jgi:hypothetical protein
MAHEKEPARRRAAVPTAAIIAQNNFLSSGPEDCEPSIELEDFRKRGVKVELEDSGEEGVEVEPEDFGKEGMEVESEYDLEERIGGNVAC